MNYGIAEFRITSINYYPRLKRHHWFLTSMHFFRVNFECILKFAGFNFHNREYFFTIRQGWARSFFRAIPRFFKFFPAISASEKPQSKS